MTVSSLALGSYLTICENVARAAALCDLEAPGGGSLGFRIVLLLIPGSQISVWHSCGLSLFVVLFYLCHTNPLVIQSYHLSCTLQGL